MMNKPLALAALAATLLLSVSTSAQAASVRIKDVSACAPAKPGSVSCLAIRRSVYRNGMRQHAATPLAGTSFSAKTLRSAYGITTLGARYKVIAVVDAMHSASAFRDVNDYRQMYGIPALANCGNPGEVITALPSGSQSCFVQVNQDSVVNRAATTEDSGWAQETALDIEMASAICPHCSILLVEAKSSSFKDLNDAVATAAAFDGVTAISNSYGGPDVPEIRQPAYAAAAAKGIAVVASSGDSGYGVNSPASFSSVIGVGGTTLKLDPAYRWSSEAAWANGGSGCSYLNPAAAWQDPNVTNCQGKHVVDVAAVADPATGVSVSYEGQWFSFGGTSAAAPIVAALFAMRADYGQSAGAYLWANRNELHDIAGGSNGKCQTLTWCNSGSGFDGPTGWGTPNGPGAF